MENTNPQRVAPFDPAALLPLYRVMRRIRAFENAAEIASQGGVAAWGLPAKAGAQVRGPLHLSTGQEAVAAGVCAALNADDLLTSTHRGHGHTLAKGADVRRMMAELFGKASGFNGGKGGSMHIADFSVGMLGANGVVAAGIAIAVGAAHGLRLQSQPAGGRSSRIVACFFGDGATNRGPFLESLNWAAVFGCPVLFICEDNRISATTPTSSMSGGDGIAGRARALGVPAIEVDGNEVEAVASAARELVALIREDNRPRLLHAVTYRFKGHVSVDAGSYRDADEVAQAVAADPLLRTRSRLLELGIEAARLDALDAEVDAEIASAVAAAEADAAPDTSTAMTDVLDAGPQWF
jgi:pyruvate dehydrogenase E1 component alpha subunit